MQKTIEFSKKIVIILICVAILSIMAHYALIFLGKEPNDNVTVTIITTVLGGIMGYMGKSAFEKNSRNKHGLDKNGVPYKDHEITEY
jgi:hypothetical protein